MSAEPTAGPAGAAGRLFRGGADEALFRAHFENLPGPAYIWRRCGGDFTLIAYNKSAAARVHSRATEFRVGAMASVLQGDQLDFVGHLRRCADSGDVEHLELDYRYRSGDVRRLFITLIPIGPENVVHHTEDITDRHVAEQALRVSEARSRALMAAYPDMLMRVSRDGVYLDVHVPEKILPTLPWRPEQILGRNVADLFDAEFARLHERYRNQALDTGRMQSWQYARLIQGEVRHCEARFVPSGDDEVVITVNDVTDRVGLEREIVNSVERERNKIGHDLHDGLGQLLTGVKLMLQPLGGRLPDDPDRRTMEHALALINQAIGQVSELARGLSPVPRDAGLSLRDALEQLARRSESFFAVSCRVSAGRSIDSLSEEHSNNLYRIAQEAVTNAVRHGGATDIELRCRIDSCRLSMAIEDNGRGLQEAPSESRGMGMHIMRYRARALGGELFAEPREGGGTRVVCCCPLPGNSCAGDERAGAGRA